MSINLRAQKNLQLVVAMLLFTILSGAIRKWVTSSSAVSNLVLLIQLLLPFIFIVLYKPLKTKYNRIDPPIIIFSMLLLVLACNPLNFTIYHGILGIVIHLGFWLFIFTYLRNREVFPLEKLTWLLLVVIVGEFVLSYLQYNLPATSFLNRYVNETEVSGIAKVGQAIRTSGTFSYISGFSSFVTLVSFIFWGQSIHPQKKYYRWLIFILGVLMALFSGARATILIFILFAIFSFFPIITLRHILRGLVISIPLIIVLAIGLTQLTIFQTSISNIRTRIEQNVTEGEAQRRVAETVLEVLDFRGDHAFFGLGLGATYQGAISIWGQSPYISAYGFYEEEGERIILEGGYVLYLFRIILYLMLFSAMRIPTLYKLALFILIVFFTNMVYNTYSSFFFFIGLAYLDRCYHLYFEQYSPPVLPLPTSMEDLEGTKAS